MSGTDDQSESETTESVADALARARRHAQAAAAESLAAIHALMDAGSLATSGTPAADGALAPLAEVLAGLESWLGTGTRREGDLVQTMLDALNGEITRWEERSRSEPEARTVLRAFLAVRELLWELERRAPSDMGQQGSESGETPAGVASARGAQPAAPSQSSVEEAPRLRRVSVQG